MDRRWLSERLNIFITLPFFFYVDEIINALTGLLHVAHLQLKIVIKI